MRIGVVRRFFGSHPDVNAVMEGSLQALKALGAELVDPADVDTAGELGEHEVEVLRYEFKADLNAYLAAAGPGAPVHSLEEVIAFNERNRARVMPFFGQERMLAAQAKGPLTDEAYRRALETGRRLAREDGIDAVLKRHRLDALVAPSGSPACLIDIVHGDYGDSDTTSVTSLAAVAGYPSIHRPGRPGPRAAGGDFLLWHGLVRAGPPPAGLCLRAGNPRPPVPPVFGDDRR